MKKILHSFLVLALIFAISIGYTPNHSAPRACVTAQTHTLSPKLKSKARLEAETIMLAVTKQLLYPPKTNPSTWPDLEASQDFNHLITNITHYLLCTAFTRIDPSMFMSMFIATNFIQLSQLLENMNDRAALHNLNFVVSLVLTPFIIPVWITYRALPLFVLFVYKLKNKVMAGIVSSPKERKHRKDALIISQNTSAAPVRISEDEITAIVKNIEDDLKSDSRVLLSLRKKESPFKDNLRRIQPTVEKYLKQAISADPISAYDKRRIKLFSLCVLIDLWNNEPELFNRDLWSFKTAFNYLAKNIRLDPTYDNANSTGKVGIPYLERLQTDFENNTGIFYLITHEIPHRLLTIKTRENWRSTEDSPVFAFKTMHEIFAILYQKKFFIRYGIDPSILVPGHKRLLMALKDKETLMEEHETALFIIEHLRKEGYTVDALAASFRDILYRSHYIINELLPESPYFLNMHELHLLTAA